jgi:hypothetical protein
LGGDDQEVDASDNEPSLGAGEVRHGQSQELWGYGGRDDREDDPAELNLRRLAKLVARPPPVTSIECVA